jgi:uncharacterized protein YjeT (DUF2065 family)
MEPIAVITALLAALFIVGRGPFVFAPAATADFYRRLFSKLGSVRIFGGLLFLLAVAMIVTARQARAAPGDIAFFIEGVGWFAAVAALVPIAFPGFSQGCILLFCSTPDDFLRTIGALNIAIGLVLGFIAFFVL